MHGDGRGGVTHIKMSPSLHGVHTNCKGTTVHGPVTGGHHVWVSVDMYIILGTICNVHVLQLSFNILRGRFSRLTIKTTL